MATKGEQFAGLTVALITPFRDGAIDERPAQTRRLARRAGHRLPRAPSAPPANRRRSTTRSTSASSPPSCEQARGRIKVMAGTGSNSTREAIRLTKFAKKAGADGALHGRPLLQQADAGRLLPALRGRRRGGATCRSCSTTSPAAPARTSCRRRSPAWPKLPDDRRRQGSDRLARPGLADRRRCATSRSCQRRRQPDAAAHEHRRPRRGLGGRQHRAGGCLALVRRSTAATSPRRSAHRKLFPLCRDMLGLATNPIPIKAAMKLLGRDTGELRLPMPCRLRPKNRNSPATLRAYGLL